MPDPKSSGGQPSRTTDGVIVVAFAIAVGLAMSVAALWPTAGRQLAVFTAPWSPPGEAARVVARAGGRLVSGGAVGWLVVVRGDAPDMVSRLYRAGAVLVTDAAFALGCTSQRRDRRET